MPSRAPGPRRAALRVHAVDEARVPLPELPLRADRGPWPALAASARGHGRQRVAPSAHAGGPGRSGGSGEEKQVGRRRRRWSANRAARDGAAAARRIQDGHDATTRFEADDPPAEAPATGLAGGSTIVVRGALVAEPPPLRLVDGGVRRRTTLRRREWLQRRCWPWRTCSARRSRSWSCSASSATTGPGWRRSRACRSSSSSFKIAGLYDRDQMRLVRSTLDEAPVLGQLVGLYVLGLTILQPVLIEGSSERARSWRSGSAASCPSSPPAWPRAGSPHSSRRSSAASSSGTADGGPNPGEARVEQRARVGRRDAAARGRRRGRPRRAGGDPQGRRRARDGSHHRRAELDGRTAASRSSSASPARPACASGPAEHARGRRVGRRARGRRRHDDARRAPVRALAVVAPAQARLRSGRHRASVC
jgi:hypothetical protein